MVLGLCIFLFSIRRDYFFSEESNIIDGGQFEVKQLVMDLLQTCSFLLLKMLIDGLNLCGLL